MGSQQTLDRIKQELRYDSDTGYLYRLRPVKGHTFGTPTGSLGKTKHGKTYVGVMLDYKRYLAHRLIWVLVYGRWPADGMEIDHIDGDGSNNKLSNLREVPHVDNQKNQRRMSTNTSGCTGVSWRKERQRWSAKMYKGKSTIYLGLFKTFEEAVAARKAAEIRYGFHPNHGSDRPL